MAKRYLTDDGEHAICPHCWSDDLDPDATRCPHCAGSFGPSQMRWMIVMCLLVALAVAAVVAVKMGMDNSQRHACEQVNRQNAAYGVPPDDC